MDNSKFLIKQITNTDHENELKHIGYDNSYSHEAVKKMLFKNLKIYGLSCAQANILKQSALSVGADCATNKNVITGKTEFSDVILSGSFSQLHKIAKKLKQQPFSLGLLAEKIENQLFEKNIKTKIVGILNLTPNSFSDGGKYDNYEAGCSHFEKLVKDGADIIDIGAESTKPGASGVSADIQLMKIIPVLNFAKEQGYNIPISIDTRSATVADECLKNGATIINDVSGLKYDKLMGEIVAKHNATLILQHSLGTEKNMGTPVTYKNVVDEVFEDLFKQTEYAKSCGINSIIVDVGIGFDKDTNESFKLLHRIKDFESLGYPIMVGLSRKSLLGIPKSSNEEKDVFSLALNSIVIEHKVDYIRVHNVKLHRKLINMLDKII